MNCPYCNDIHYSNSYLPSTQFNGKIFNYLKCKKCNVLYINPIPDEKDYLKMYSPDYQSGVCKTILSDQYQKLPGLRFSYGVQFDIIRSYFPERPIILDYGCGDAHFLLNAYDQGFLCHGAEYNKAHVDILKKEIPASVFYTIDEIQQNTTLQYNVIRLSNVLEHLENPNEVIRLLLSRLTKNGLLLVEGPLENNLNFAFLTRKVYFICMRFIRNGYWASHEPNHITFTNSKNQCSFFSKFDLEKLRYMTTEGAWPYPESVRSSPGIGGKSKAIIAKFSILMSRMIPGWGNTFMYVGRKK